MTKREAIFPRSAALYEMNRYSAAPLGDILFVSCQSENGSGGGLT